MLRVYAVNEYLNAMASKHVSRAPQVNSGSIRVQIAGWGGARWRTGNGVEDGALRQDVRIFGQQRDRDDAAPVVGHLEVRVREQEKELGELFAALHALSSRWAVRYWCCFFR